MSQISRRAFLLGGTVGAIDLALESQGVGLVGSVLRLFFPKQDEAIIERARRELKNEGITSEQRKAHGFLSERAYKTVSPFGYEPAKVVKDLWGGEERRYSAITSREAAWKMYLGIPLDSQERGIFDVSDYKPSNDSGETPYYYSLPQAEREILNAHLDIEANHEKYIAMRDQGLPAPHGFQEYSGGKTVLTDESRSNFVMGRFKVERGKDQRGDYVSYYDVWDLNPRINGVSLDMSLLAGKPFEIYNRIYFDPITGKQIQPGN